MVQFLGYLPKPEFPELPNVGNALNTLAGHVGDYRNALDKRTVYEDQQEQKRHARGRASASDGDAKKKILGQTAASIMNLPDDDPRKPMLWQKVLQSHGGANLSHEEQDWKTGPALMAVEAGFVPDPMAQEERRLKLEKLRRDASGTDSTLDDEYKRAQIDKLRAEAQNPKQQFTPAETAVDRAFAKTYEEDFASGNFADQQKNIDQLRGVERELTSGEKNLTGPVLGSMPDFITSFTNPDAVNTREKVEEVVQRNLRVILGAQFTNEEGKRLIARAYNPKLPEDVNAQRLTNLIRAMDNGMKAKQAAAQYYEQNGTLRGYRGPAPLTAADIDAAIESAGATASSPAGSSGFRYLGPAD